MKNFFYNYFIPALHILIIIAFFLSPWLIPWQYIVLIFILYRLQLIVFKGCVLSHLQFGDKNEGFYYFYLKKVFPNIKVKKIDLFINNIIPAVLIIVAYIIQTK